MGRTKTIAAKVVVLLGDEQMELLSNFAKSINSSPSMALRMWLSATAIQMEEYTRESQAIQARHKARMERQLPQPLGVAVSPRHAQPAAPATYEPREGDI